MITSTSILFMFLYLSCREFQISDIKYCQLDLYCQVSTCCRLSTMSISNPIKSSLVPASLSLVLLTACNIQRHSSSPTADSAARTAIKRIRLVELVLPLGTRRRRL